RIDDPSKPSPSSKVSLSRCTIGKEQCCQLPSMSTNFRSTISASFFFAYEKKSSGVFGKSPVAIGPPFVKGGTLRQSQPGRNTPDVFSLVAMLRWDPPQWRDGLGDNTQMLPPVPGLQRRPRR